MFRFPYFGYPYYYNYYPGYPKNTSSSTSQKVNTNNSTNATNNNIDIRNKSLKNTQYSNMQINKNASITTKENFSSNTSNSRFSNSKEDVPIFEILGIKLFLDDIIILCILFFLYQEKVHDEMLYIILFLLLFS